MRCEIDLARHVDKRGQLPARRDLTRCDELRHFEHAHPWIGRTRVDKRDRGVRGAEIEADQVTRGDAASYRIPTRPALSRLAQLPDLAGAGSRFRELDPGMTAAHRLDIPMNTPRRFALALLSLGN